MTQTFWLSASVLILLALLFVVAPLIFHRSGRRAALDLRNQNLLAYRSRMDELDRELESGTLDQESYDQLRDELAGGLLDDVPDADRGVLGGPEQVKGGRSSMIVILGSLAAIPIASFFLYEQWGSLEEVEQFITMQEMASSDGSKRGQMQELAGQLREKLEASPENSEGWGMLGRTYMNLQQYSDAAWAYEQLANSFDSNGGDGNNGGNIEGNEDRKATALGLSAQALFFQNEGQLAGGVSNAIEKARALNPDEVNSLGLLGITAFSEENYEQALVHWERIVTVAPDHPQIASIRQGIDEAYQRLGRDAPATQEDSQQAQPGVAVRVEIDPALQADIADETPLFVFARAANATGGAPLAVARLTAGQLPAVIRLTDQNAMSPQALISGADEVRVQARLSRSGNALPQAGDWEGQVADPIPVDGGESEPVTLVIETQLTN